MKDAVVDLVAFGTVLLCATVGVESFPVLVRGFGVLRVFGAFSFLGFLVVCGFLGVLGDALVGVVVGIVVGVSGLLLLLGVFSVVVEVGQRRAAQVPAHLRAVQPLTPRTLRWVGGLLPGDEGAAWLAEMASCLVQTPDKGERRRYVRSYRRNVPRLIWTSWAVRLSGSRRRELL